MTKLDVARCNHRSQDYSYDLDNVKHSSYYYEYDRNDPNRPNPFGELQIIQNYNGIIKQTLDHIEEAESHVRAAIKSAAVNEKPLVVKQLAQLLMDMEQCKSLMKLWIC